MKQCSAALALLLVCYAVALIMTTEGAVPCATVDVKAGSCVMYATGKAPNPAPACCTGLQQLAQSVKSVGDKKDICRCLKSAVKSFPGVQDKFLSQIPASCNIQVGFPVSLTTNCETLKCTIP